MKIKRTLTIGKAVKLIADNIPEDSAKELIEYIVALNEDNKYLARRVNELSDWSGAQGNF